MELLNKINRTPPKLCRLFAREGPANNQRPMSDREIARKSGLAHSTIVRLSKMDHWDGITFSTYQAFTHACRVDPMNAHGHRLLFRRKDVRLVYMKNATPQQQRMFDRILKPTPA